MSSALLINYALMAGLAVVVVANAKGPRLFSFGFLFPAVWIAFVLVGLAEFIQAGGPLYRTYEDLGVLDMTLIMLVTSSVGGLLGYVVAGGGQPSVQKEPADVAPSVARRMNQASWILAVMSYVAFVLLANLTGGLSAYLFESGAYSIVYEGLPVYLVFVVRFGYVSIVIQLWLWSRTKDRKHMASALLFSLIPLVNVFFIFRRSEVVKLGIFYGYFLANYSNLRLGRIHAAIGMVAMGVVMRVFPLLRSEEGKSQSLGVLFDEAFAQRETFDNSEIGAGMFRIYHAMSHGSYEFGAIFWNMFVKQFVPGGLVGRDFKQTLMLGVSDYTDTAFVEFRYYISPMGFAQAYQQFWLFGCLLFVLIGALVARMEQRRHDGPRKEVFFVLMLPALVLTVSADMRLIVPHSITSAVLVALAVPRQRLRETA